MDGCDKMGDWSKIWMGVTNWVIEAKYDGFDKMGDWSKILH